MHHGPFRFVCRTTNSIFSITNFSQISYWPKYPFHPHPSPKLIKSASKEFVVTQSHRKHSGLLSSNKYLRRISSPEHRNSNFESNLIKQLEQIISFPHSAHHDWRLSFSPDLWCVNIIIFIKPLTRFLFLVCGPDGLLHCIACFLACFF